MHQQPSWTTGLHNVRFFVLLSDPTPIPMEKSTSKRNHRIHFVLQNKVSEIWSLLYMRPFWAILVPDGESMCHY